MSFSQSVPRSCTDARPEADDQMLGFLMVGPCNAAPVVSPFRLPPRHPTRTSSVDVLIIFHHVYNARLGFFQNRMLKAQSASAKKGPGIFFWH